MTSPASPLWLSGLLDALDTRLAGAATPRPDLLDVRDRVRLALMAGHCLGLGPDDDPGLQIVVTGPTQAGKSTLVNRLLDAQAAGVSALAGHTVHAQAFVQQEGLADSTERLQPLMAPLRLVPRAALDQDTLDVWSAQPITSGPRAIAPPSAIVWDTPDFDSVAAGRYREAVILSTALADVIVMVLSKDKYGDDSVWQQLGVLRAIGVPLVLVINKVDAASEGTIRAAVQARLDARPGTAPVACVLLPWIDPQADGEPVWPAQVHAAMAAAVREAIGASAGRIQRRSALNDYIAAQRDAWLGPLREEHAAHQQWTESVTAAAERVLADYRQRWLDAPDNIDAFDRTLVELLALLEIPGLARVLSRTRDVVTWPARRLLGVAGRAVQQGGGAVGGAFGGMAGKLARRAGARLGLDSSIGPGAARALPADRERELLEALYDSAMTELRERVLDAREAGASAAWQQIDSGLSGLRAPLRERWHAEVASLHDEFQPRIEAAAQKLYERLQSQPALLNTLRATRITTDAAGVALAVKSGGLAPADLVLAPAMLSVTTLLTESALGRYLDSIKRELREQQLELVEQRLLRKLFEPELHALAGQQDPAAPASASPARADARAALHAEIEASVSRVGPVPHQHR